MSRVDLYTHTELDAARWEAAYAEPDEPDQPDARELAEDDCWDRARPSYRKAA